MSVRTAPPPKVDERISSGTPWPASSLSTRCRNSAESAAPAAGTAMSQGAWWKRSIQATSWCTALDSTTAETPLASPTPTASSISRAASRAEVRCIMRRAPCAPSSSRAPCSGRLRKRMADALQQVGAVGNAAQELAHLALADEV